MADFTNGTITRLGASAIAASQTGEVLTFTKIALGDGELPEGVDPRDVTALYGTKAEVEPTYIKPQPPDEGDDPRSMKVLVGGTYANDSNLEGFKWRELGVFAQTETTGEVLYAYGNAGDKGDEIPPSNGANVVEKAIDAIVVVSPDMDVRISVSLKSFITMRELTDELDKLKRELAESGKAHEAELAEKLKDARDIQVDLTSGDPASFDGSANASPGVSGVLGIQHGGHGGSTVEQARKNLGIENAAGAATADKDGLMSQADKKKLDTITGGTASQVVLGDGTVKDIAALLQENIETIRTALGVVTKESDGLVPKLPENPEAE